MVLTRLLDLLNLIDEAIEGEDHRRALQLILNNWYGLPDPSPLRERAGLLLATVGRKKEAVEVYSIVAKHYANSGYPTRALAAIKQMQALNPSSTQLLDHFTTLYSVRSPFLERGRQQADLPRPAGKLQDQVADDGELDELFQQALQRATDMEGTAERPGALPALPLLSLLPPKTLRRLLDLVEYEIFAKAQPVFNAQSGAGDLIWSVSPDLLITELDEPMKIPAGSMLGLNAFGPDAPDANHTVVSHKGSECLRLTAAAIAQISEEFPDFPNRLATLRRHALTEGIFHRHPMFQNVDLDVPDALPDRLMGLKLPPGTVCVRQDKTSPGLYVLLDGKVDIVCSDDDWELTIGTLQAGEVFGDIGLVDPRPSPATAITTTDCHVLYLSRKYFTAFCEKFPSVAEYSRARGAERAAAIEEAIAAIDLAEME